MTIIELYDSTPAEGFLAAVIPICFFFNQWVFRDSQDKFKIM